LDDNKTKITVFAVSQSKLPSNAQILLGIEHLKGLQVSLSISRCSVLVVSLAKQWRLGNRLSLVAILLFSVRVLVLKGLTSVCLNFCLAARHLQWPSSFYCSPGSILSGRSLIGLCQQPLSCRSSSTQFISSSRWLFWFACLSSLRKVLNSHDSVSLSLRGPRSRSLTSGQLTSRPRHKGLYRPHERTQVRLCFLSETLSLWKRGVSCSQNGGRASLLAKIRLQPGLA
jgi:hypothetical protein